MTLTRKDFIVTLAGLLVAWLGLTLVWLGVVGETSPVALVLVLGGMIGIFFPALQQTYQDDLAKFPADVVRKAWVRRGGHGSGDNRRLRRPQGGNGRRPEAACPPLPPCRGDRRHFRSYGDGKGRAQDLPKKESIAVTEHTIKKGAL